MTAYWLHNNGVVRDTSECPGEGLFCKPRRLVVIDPEDDRQVHRLTGALVLSGQGRNDRNYWRETQAALRSLIKPPRPEEPTTWGVVEASCSHDDTRRKWVRHEDGNWWPAWTYGDQPSRTPLPDDWDSLVDPVVLREGVQ